jgi:hypothetical protein
MADLDLKKQVNKITLRGDRSLWLIKKLAAVDYTDSIQRQGLTRVSILAAIYNNNLVATTNKITMAGFAGTNFSLQSKIVISPKLNIKSAITHTNLINCHTTISNKVIKATAQRQVSLNGTLNITPKISINAKVDISSYLAFIQKVNLLAFNFGGLGTANSTNNLPINKTIVLNLRTKAHCTFEEAHLNAWAITGEMNCGSYKNKNISDAFVYGRSASSIDIGIWNDEITRRDYSITYEEAEQANLKNKKVKLSKGLVGTNWQIRFANTDEQFAEVRGVDLFVSELKRHV